jgi:diacylglycerol kinase family enzyme
VEVVPVGLEKKHLFIINPRSFSGGRDINRVIAEIVSCFEGPGRAAPFRSHGAPPVLPGFNAFTGPYAIHIARFPRDAIVVIRKYMAAVAGAAMVRVYSIGGDGAAFGCLNGIVGLPNAELALIPYGSGNDFVRSFGEGLTGELRKIEAQIEAPTIPVDIIHCGTNYALNSCSIGIEAVAIRKVQGAQKKFWKLRRRYPVLNGLLYTLSGVAVAFDREGIGQRYRMTIDDGKVEDDLALIYLANGRGYGVDKIVIPEAVPNDGSLDMLTVTKTSTIKTLRLLPSYMKGEYKKHPSEIIYRRVKRVSVSSDTPLCIALDGEVFFDSSIDIEIVPRAVRVAAVGGRSFINSGAFCG